MIYGVQCGHCDTRKWDYIKALIVQAGLPVKRGVDALGHEDKTVLPAIPAYVPSRHLIGRAETHVQYANRLMRSLVQLLRLDTLRLINVSCSEFLTEPLCDPALPGWRRSRVQGASQLDAAITGNSTAQLHPLIAADGSLGCSRGGVGICFGPSCDLSPLLTDDLRGDQETLRRVLDLARPPPSFAPALPAGREPAPPPFLPPPLPLFGEKLGALGRLPPLRNKPPPPPREEGRDEAASLKR